MPLKRNCKPDWDAFWEAAKTSKLTEIPAALRIMHYSALTRIAKDYCSKGPDNDTERGVWIWGPSGVGKSRHARAFYPDAYDKDANKWWDGYQGEAYAILDDLDPTTAKLMGGARRLKIWGDRYAFTGETKGGRIAIPINRFIVTSQFSIDQCFDLDKDRWAMKRRFTVVHIPWPRIPSLSITN